jgi:hypothetical protein
MMAILYKLVGFDHDTEALSIIHEIPSEKISQAKRIAGIANRPDIIADWPLSRDQARAITDLIGAELDVDHMDWALEPYAAPDATP